MLFLLVDDWGGGDANFCPKGMPAEECPFGHLSPGRSEVLFTPRMSKMASEGMIMSNW